MNTPQANTGSMASTSNESASASFLFSDDDEDENNKVAGSVGAEDVPDSSGEQDMHDMMDVDMPGVGNLLQGHVQGPFHRPLPDVAGPFTRRADNPASYDEKASSGSNLPPRSPSVATSTATHLLPSPPSKSTSANKTSKSGSMLLKSSTSRISLVPLASSTESPQNGPTSSQREILEEVGFNRDMNRRRARPAASKGIQDNEGQSSRILVRTSASVNLPTSDDEMQLGQPSSKSNSRKQSTKSNMSPKAQAKPSTSRDETASSKTTIPVQQIIDIASSDPAEQDEGNDGDDSLLLEIERAQAKESDEDESYDEKGKGKGRTRWEKKGPDRKNAKRKSSKTLGDKVEERDTRPKRATKRKRQASGGEESATSLPTVSTSVAKGRNAAQVRAEAKRAQREVAENSTPAETVVIESEGDVLTVANGPGARVLKQLSEQGSSENVTESTVDKAERTQKAKAVSKKAKADKAITKGKLPKSSELVDDEDVETEAAAAAGAPQARDEATAEATTPLVVSSIARKSKGNKAKKVVVDSSEGEGDEKDEPKDGDAPEEGSESVASSRSHAKALSTTASGKGTKIVVEIPVRRSMSPRKPTATKRNLEQDSKDVAKDSPHFGNPHEGAESSGLAKDGAGVTEDIVPTKFSAGKKRKSPTKKSETAPRERKIVQTDDDDDDDDEEDVGDISEAEESDDEAPAQPRATSKPTAKAKQLKKSPGRKGASKIDQKARVPSAMPASHSAAETCPAPADEPVASTSTVVTKDEAKSGGIIQPKASKNAVIKPLLSVCHKIGGALGVKSQGMSKKHRPPPLLSFRGEPPAKRPPLPVEKKKLKKGQEIYSDEDQEELKDQPEEWWDREDYVEWEKRKRKRMKARGELDDDSPPKKKHEAIAGPSGSGSNAADMEEHFSD